MSDLDDRPPRFDWIADEWDDVVVVPAVEQVRRQNRIIKWVVWILLALLAGAVILAGYLGWWYLERVQPEGDGGPPRAFTVRDDEDLPSLARRLERSGLVVDAEVFEWYVDQQGGLEIVPGFYELPVDAHMGDVLQRLGTPPEETFERITFPEGYTIEQMADRLAETFPRLSADDFVTAANSPQITARLRQPGVTSLEGLLFPDTYQISNADSASQIVAGMVALMERVADQEDISLKAPELGLTPYQVLVVASMIEEEAKLEVDRPLIARVIYNRLAIGQNLELDATLYYGQDRSTPFPELRALDTPYNTYRYGGLPPTPISNPGRASIRAALNPAPDPPASDVRCRDLPDPTTQCKLLYYVLATEEGGHEFAVTFEQHEQNIRDARAAGIL